MFYVLLKPQLFLESQECNVKKAYDQSNVFDKKITSDSQSPKRQPKQHNLSLPSFFNNFAHGTV